MWHRIYYSYTIFSSLAMIIIGDVVSFQTQWNIYIMLIKQNYTSKLTHLAYKHLSASIRRRANNALAKRLSSNSTSKKMEFTPFVTIKKVYYKNHKMFKKSAKTSW